SRGVSRLTAPGNETVRQRIPARPVTTREAVFVGWVELFARPNAHGAGEVLGLAQERSTQPTASSSRASMIRRCLTSRDIGRETRRTRVTAPAAARSAVFRGCGAPPTKQGVSRLAA